MVKLMDKISEEHPDARDDLKELFLGLQIINNKYVLKRYREFKTKEAK